MTSARALIVAFIVGTFAVPAAAQTLPDPQQLMAQIRKDTANRPLIDDVSGVRNWTYRDVVELKREGDRLTSVTQWFPKPENREPANRMCRYLAGYGFARVRVVGQGGAVLATCQPLRMPR